MSDSPEDPRREGESDSAERESGSDAVTGRDGAPTDETVTDEGATDEDLEQLRQEVEEKYDFENFGPADMAEMTLEEWEVAFDPETWITGEALLDRVERDLQARIADREVFARLEREDDPLRLVAYSDEGYAVVYPDGSVTGEGTVVRDVKPSVALCSMESYDVPEPPEDATLPEPEEVPEQSGELGNLMLQVIAGIQLVAALVLFGAGIFTFGDGGSNAWLLFVAGFGFLAVGLLLFFTVANARLSDAFRAEEYRNRLRAVGDAEDARPDFLSPEANGERAERPSITDREQGSGNAENADGSVAGSAETDGVSGAETGDVSGAESGGAPGDGDGPKNR